VSFGSVLDFTFMSPPTDRAAFVGSTRGPLDVRGGKGDDRLLGSSRDDHLLGGPGADTADGRGGADRCVAETRIRCER